MAVSYPPTWFSTKWHVLEVASAFVSNGKINKHPGFWQTNHPCWIFSGLVLVPCCFQGNHWFGNGMIQRKVFKTIRDDPLQKVFQPPKRINSEKKTFTLHELAMQGLGRQRPGFQTSGCLPHRLWWLQPGGLKDILGWGWWRKRGQGD